MKLTLTPTDELVELELPGGAVAPARVWTGETENGVPVVCWITRVLVPTDQPPEVHAQFKRELQEKPAPRAGPRIFDVRQIL